MDNINEVGIVSGVVFTILFFLVKSYLTDIKNLIKEHGKDIAEIKIIIGIEKEKSNQNKTDHNYFREQNKNNKAKIDTNEKRLITLENKV